jgi:hypothetical protein
MFAPIDEGGALNNHVMVAGYVVMRVPIAARRNTVARAPHLRSAMAFS